MKESVVRFEAVAGEGVSGVILTPEGATAALVLAHGAGAGMRHKWMEAMAHQLAAASVATFRYQFPYMERGGGPPNSKKTLTETVRSAVRFAGEAWAGLPLFAGGKSMGGRMTSLAQSESPLEVVRGIIFFGFPLGTGERKIAERKEHLSKVHIPMLFFQGTRDTLAEIGAITDVVAGLPRAKLHVLDTADHSFHVLKSSGKTDDDAMREMALAVRDWCAGV